MELEVFLYGRTRTYDYFDMYIPSWLDNGSDEYREYRKTVSFIMKIRDILSEEKSEILNRTANSFVFYRGRKISMLCRFCHVCGKDEFDRPICSTEGFITKIDNLKEFWKQIPDMILHLSSSDKTYYNEYQLKHGDESKPVGEIRIDHLKSSYTASVPLTQYNALKKAVEKSSVPFSFAFGDEEKKLYDYSKEYDLVKINVFFTADECTEIPEEPEKQKKDADLGSMKIWIDIKKTVQGRLRYRLVLGEVPGADKKISKIPYVSYERECGLEIKLSELYKMHETLISYISENDIGNTQKKCIPYNSEIDAEYSEKNAFLEYRPPEEQKRSIFQILKGVKPPDFSEYLYLRNGEDEKLVNQISGIYYMSDEYDSRLTGYDEIMEAFS